jgi:hypothetical protein
MTKYLLDTNVVLRFCNPFDRQHSLATDSISYLVVPEKLPGCGQGKGYEAEETV